MNEFLKRVVALPILFALPCYSFEVAKAADPATFTFPELVRLAAVDPVAPDLQSNLNALLSTPFIRNDYARNIGNPSSLQVAEWNINRGENEAEVLLALADAQAYLSRARQSSMDANKLADLRSQLQALQSADIIVLDEVDYGVKRTAYRNVVHDIASALKMNYAYGVEFIELNRIYMRSEKRNSDQVAPAKVQENFDLDPGRYLGLEGSAVLSRYPIKAARIIRLPEEYDWYHEEINAVSNIERVRRWTADRVFDEQIKRQIRRGGRMALIVDVEIPGSSTGTVTVISPHLEDYSGPKGRRNQMNALLPQIAAIRNPVIIAGDMNTTGSNGRPLTPQRLLRRYLLNYRFWAREIFFFLLPVPGAGELFRAADYFKNLHDPTAFSVPLVLRNPSRRFFKDVRAFRFEDGGRLSFDGSRERSFRHRGSTLADSNQRAWKGFETTFSFNRTFGGLVGVYKIDWFFIKPAQAPGRPSSFAPQFGRTLALVNTSLGMRISDHDPIVVTLPITKHQ
jgi:endonuclease/exonuclease/phosphatase family metal-dependent hydrolase